MVRPLQAHGRRSKVYTPVLIALFRKGFVKGAIRIAFTLEDVRTFFANSAWTDSGR